MDHNFDKELMNIVKKTASKHMISSLAEDYYNETLEAATQNPSAFGEQSDWAQDDPKGFAQQYASSYKEVLIKRRRKDLETLYAYYIRDELELEAEEEKENAEEDN